MRRVRQRMPQFFLEQLNRDGARRGRGFLAGLARDGQSDRSSLVARRTPSGSRRMWRAM
jgi:hypothetical protein